MAGLTLPMVAPRATPTPGQGVPPDGTDPTASPAYAPAPAPAPSAPAGWQQAMYAAAPMSRGMGVAPAMTGRQQIAAAQAAEAALPAVGMGRGIQGTPQPTAGMQRLAAAQAAVAQPAQTLLDARAQAAQPTAAAVAPAPMGPFPQMGPAGLAGKGLYAYDTVAGPTRAQTAAIAQDQFRRNGMPLSGVADAMNGVDSTGGGMPSPAAMAQPALAAAAPRMIPLGVAERLATLSGQQQTLQAAQTKQALTERYMTNANTKFQLATKAAGSDAEKIAAAEKEHQNAILSILNPASIAPVNTYGG